MSIRQAAVAGTFYEANASGLQAHIDALLSAVTPRPGTMPEALIVPHAGLIYSGSTAAEAYACLRVDPGRIERVLLVGPAHRVYVDGMAIPSVDAFATPLGDIPLHRQGLDAIREFPGVEVSDEAHREEHCLEVQLPFLQTVLDAFSLIPLLVGDADASRVGAIIDAFGGAPGTLVIISSDLSHYLQYRQARKTDAQTCARIVSKATTLTGKEACGARAINGLMVSAYGQKHEITLLHACNSGDTAGSRDRVVGYGAFVLH